MKFENPSSNAAESLDGHHVRATGESSSCVCCRPLITAAELSQWLGIRRQQVYQLRRDGILPYVEVGRAIRFDPVAITAFLREGGAAFAHGWRKQARS